MTQAKFKIGDRVRLLDKHDQNDLTIGKVYEIIDSCPYNLDYVWKIKNDNKPGNCAVKESWIEKVTSTKPFTPPFYVDCPTMDQVVYWTTQDYQKLLEPSYTLPRFGSWFDTPSTPIKSSFKEKSMSLLKRLLDPELKLIEKYCMDDDGDLDFTNSMVQEALLKTDGFKKNLVELCQAKAKEEKKK